MSEQTSEVPADVTTVRLLINDPDGAAFTVDEISSFLTLEGGNVKRAAAQAVDTIADNEALVAKYVTDHQITIDGTKVADSLRKRAQTLREQADADEENDGFYFDIIGGY